MRRKIVEREGPESLADVFFDPRNRGSDSPLGVSRKPVKRFDIESRKLADRYGNFLKRNLIERLGQVEAALLAAGAFDYASVGELTEKLQDKPNRQAALLACLPTGKGLGALVVRQFENGGHGVER